MPAVWERMTNTHRDTVMRLALGAQSAEVYRLTREPC
jgi:hypothetical protein